MDTKAFKSLPSLEQVVGKVIEQHQKLDMALDVLETISARVADLEKGFAELNLQMLFVMHKTTFAAKASAIADASGQIKTIKCSLLQLYAAQREQFLASLEVLDESAQKSADDAAGVVEGNEGDESTPVVGAGRPTLPITH